MRVTNVLPEEWDIKLKAGNSWPPDSFSLTMAGAAVSDATATIKVFKAGELFKTLTEGSGLIKDGNKFTIDPLFDRLPAYKSYTHEVIITLADTRTITIYEGKILSKS